MTHLAAALVYVLFAISIGSIALSILRPDLRTWPPPQRSRWPRPLLAIVRPALPLGLIGLLLLGVLDWNSLDPAPWIRGVGGVSFVGLGFWAGWGYLTLGWQLSNGAEGDLIDTGAYRYCRNPQYIGTIGASCGYALICGSSLALVASGLGAIVFLLLPFAEEPWLREHLGVPYEDYCARVDRFVPSFTLRPSGSGGSGP